MRVRTLEIRWHDSKPISTCDFQPVAYKKARPATEKGFAGQAYRLATGGEDNHVRLWMVHPNIMPQSVLESASTSATGAMPTPRPPRVEYLATLSRHSAAVNVVRFSPNGELIASAGDDGMIIVWAPSNSPNATSYGSDLSAEELQYEKEHWKPRTVFRCTTMQVYDLAWSPTGEYIIAGSTDNCARIFSSADGKCVHEIAEHNHYVQGVAWDPLNEYVATQSSDRSMHVYDISTKSGTLEVHAIGKNTRMAHRHHRTSSSHSRPRTFRRESTASETESVITTASEWLGDEAAASSTGSNHYGGALLTPTASVPSTPSGNMFPPPSLERSSSRRSSFSGSQAAASPRANPRTGRSPSPMPALPAIRPSPAAIWRSIKLYGDESYTNFFRRLTFSPDGGLLLTPAGHFEDPSVVPGPSKTPNGNGKGEARGRKGNPAPIVEENNDAGASCVYIYSRANFARSPIARLSGHKKPSVAVRFSPILYELRSGVVGPGESEPSTINVTVEKGKNTDVAIDVRRASTSAEVPQASEDRIPESLAKESQSSSKPLPGIASPSPRIAIPAGPAEMMMPSPALSAADSLRPPTPSQSKPGTPIPAPPPPATGSIFALQYRMLYAVATMDTVTIYDTQQGTPVCLLTKLHYDEFTDMSWSSDGQCLMISSRDGYCTLVILDEILPAHHTQQNTLQLQSIAHQHSLPLTSSTVATPISTPSHTSVALPTISPALTPVVGVKRRAESQAPLTPAPSVVSVDDASGSSRCLPDEPTPAAGEPAPVENQEPPKKKRRAALTKVGDIGS